MAITFELKEIMFIGGVVSTVRISAVDDAANSIREISYDYDGGSRLKVNATGFLLSDLANAESAIDTLGDLAALDKSGRHTFISTNVRGPVEERYLF